jgi:hypothetical protein
MSRPATAGFLCLALAVSAGCRSPYLLTVEDCVGRVGEEVRLIGKLEYRGLAVFNKGLDDRNLSFFLDGRRVDTDDTNHEGYAKAEYEFHRPGAHRLVVAYDADGERKAETAATVFVWQRHDPILIVDVDGTLARTRKRYLLSFSSPDRSPAMEAAPDVLLALAERFQIVYLSARPREMIPKTHHWLQRNGFPIGPVWTWDVDRDPWSREDYKEDRIDDLQDDFDCVTIGIGDQESDHEAYRKRKLFTILLDSDEPPQHIRRGVMLPDWSAVRDLFARNPKLYDADLSYKCEVELPFHAGGD